MVCCIWNLVYSLSNDKLFNSRHISRRCGILFRAVHSSNRLQSLQWRIRGLHCGCRDGIANSSRWVHFYPRFLHLLPVVLCVLTHNVPIRGVKRLKLFTLLDLVYLMQTFRYAELCSDLWVQVQRSQGGGMVRESEFVTWRQKSNIVRNKFSLFLSPGFNLAVIKKIDWGIAILGKLDEAG